MFKKLNPTYNSEIKIYNTIESCKTIPQLECACQMANNYINNLRNYITKNKWRIFLSSPLQWVDNYKYIQKLIIHHNNFQKYSQDIIDAQTNYINLMNEESIVPPEKVIVRGFQI